MYYAPVAVAGVAITNSKGLIVDSEIVSEITKNWDVHPRIHYENYYGGSSDDWIFVNLDMTDFNKLSKPDAPGHILCKTLEAYNVLKHEFPGKKVYYTGFTSRDRYDAGIVKNWNKFLHIPGKSPFKGTNLIVKAWVQHPEWPLLTIVCRNVIDTNMVGMIMQRMEYIRRDNIQVISDEISDEEVVNL